MVRGLLISFINDEPIETIANEADYRKILGYRNIDIRSIEIDGHIFNIVYNGECLNSLGGLFTTVQFLSKNGKKEIEEIIGNVLITGVAEDEEGCMVCGNLTDEEIHILKAHIKYEARVEHSVLYCPYQEVRRSYLNRIFGVKIFSKIYRIIYFLTIFRDIHKITPCIARS